MIRHDFTCMVGSQTSVPIALVGDGDDVCIEVAGSLAWAVSRKLLADSLVWPNPVSGDSLIGIHVIDDAVVMDIADTLPLHIVAELAEVEEFLDLSYADDPERVDARELAEAMGAEVVAVDR